MEFPETAVICGRCSQLCFRPVGVQLTWTDKRLRLVCNDCFESAIRRSGGRITEQVDGHLTVAFLTGPIVQVDL